MSTPVWCEIVCNQCSVQAPGKFAYGAIPRRLLLKWARREGFEVIDGEPYCRKCTQRKNRKA